MDPPSDASVCQWSVNTDISGIGVRLSFYLQSFLLVILVDRSWQDAPSALWTFIATSFGLTVSAVVQSHQGQLSFFQALQVMNLVWLANFGTFLALATFSRHRRSANKKQEAGRRKRRVPWLLSPWTGSAMKIAAACQTFLTMALTIYAWTHQDDERTFPKITQWSDGDSSSSSDPACEPKPLRFYAFFGAHFEADKSGRTIGLTFSSILMVVYLAITAHELYSYVRHRVRPRAPGSDVEAGLGETELEQDKMAGQDKDLPELPRVVVTEASAPPSVSDHRASPFLRDTEGSASSGASSAGSSFSHSSANVRTVSSQVPTTFPPPPPSPTPTSRSGKRKRPRRRGQCDIDPMFLGIFFSFIFFAYFVSTTELLISKNPAADTNQWAFGQIFAMILVVPSFISVVQALQERGFGRIHHRLTKKFTRARQRRNLSNALRD